MIFSVIIVNYRVRYFLELCLASVQKALRDIGPSEIIVVDNHSADGSIEVLRRLYPGVRFIENQENVGFARANNQGAAVSTGEYILFLNPDTIVPEELARVCLGFMKDKPLAGGVGVRMVDGDGRFLPESRRGFPSPWVAFCKLSGLSALFPKSAVFAGYYLGGLPADQTHPAPVLSGACFLVRRAVFTAAGGFDERFFMYAEDIDLSYAVEKAGYTNYYLADTTIVHFKGESTRKDIRYIRQFYKAMSQFRRKHFNRGLPAVFNAGMEAAIWVRTGIGRLALRADDSGPAGPWSVWITGDVDEAGRVRSLLSGSRDWVIVSEQKEAAAVLFCEGPGFSFRECITALPAVAGKGQRVLFHASGSRSAAGSSDREGQGETVVF